MRKEDIRVIVALSLLLIAAAVTFMFSDWIEGGKTGAAASFLSGTTVYEVSLYDDRAEPADLTIQTGDEVLFAVKEGFHNIAEERTSRKDARLESGELDANTTYSLKFNAPGSIELYDRLNLDIRIRIKVED